ncbi:unnamed protein product [Rotaria sordida]|uniref:EGF-like domain-containing protein n=1 Tax=Rotaria sordida TaxID=392033 RepID=A0A814YW44_9BILA|nr:unnamed protein product [Rotaria sordida]
MNVTLFRWLLIVVTKIIYFVDANWFTGNLCWSMPCMNGGSCFGSAYTYLCVCPMNYSGALCEKRLGICQESPCGNRGLCVETSLTSFECRCYFDYMGPLCEEHVPKDDPSVWSSLIPVHTRVLFDILQEAYRVKVHGKSAMNSNNDHIDFVSLLTTNGASSSDTTSSTILKSNLITYPSETTEREHVIRAEDIQLEKIFPKISKASTTNMYKQDFIETTSQIFETTEPNIYNNETNFETNMTSSMMISTIENITTTILPSLETIENMTTISLEQNQTNSLNITEDQEFINITQQFNTMITSTPFEWSSSNSDNDKITGFTHDLIQNSTEQNNNNTESNEFIINTTTPQTIDYTLFETSNYLSTQSDNNQFNTSEQIISSTNQPLISDKLNDRINNSQDAENQLLYKLCQQLLSHILPNVSSLSSLVAVEAALSLVSNASSTGNNSTDELLTWIKEQLSSSTTITTSTTTTTLPSTLSSLLIRENKFTTMSLQRVEMDDVLHQMNNNIDSEQ